MKKFFEEPTQVMFIDKEEGWQYGIAYRDEIICGCCGGIFDIEEVIEDAPDYVQCPIHEYENWTDISTRIRDGVYPDSFIIEPNQVGMEDLSE